MLRFLVSLWISKFALFIYKKTNRVRNDRPGLLANKICPNFLKYVKKPKLVIGISGTNGKTTVTNLVYNILKMDNKKVAFNDWGANMPAGHARCFLDTVNIFNKSKVNVVLLEIDEVTSYKSMSKIKLDYLIVTNICRDSIRRNGNIENIFNILNKAVDCSPDTVLILNADDPISSFLGKNNKRIYYSIDGDNNKELISNINDFEVCPKCGGKPIYEYRNYNSIGKFHCSLCDMKSFNSDYIAKKVDYKNFKITVCNKNILEIYPLISDSIFNAYNILSVITLFKTLGIDSDKLCEYIKKLTIPKSRESIIVVNGIKLYTYLTKGQNVSAASTVFDYLSKEKSSKELILLLDEVFGSLNATETITWLYETDFEFLNNKNIKKIIVGGERYLDYKARLLLAGIEEERIICIKNEYETIKYVDLNVDSIYILHEADAVSKAQEIRLLLKNDIERRQKNEKN